MPPNSSLTIHWVSKTAVLLALTLAVQMLGLPPPITGPLINAFLLIAAVTTGMTSGIVIGLLTPWVAFLRGILPAPLGPLIPFIMIGNAALVCVFSMIRLKRKTLSTGIIGVGAGAVVKYLILAFAVRVVVDVPLPVARVMQFPQLLTALAGGAIALVLEQALIRVRYLRNGW
ncbi:MAG TPA: ECF transporter S component [Atribacteraceae bacterium]|nr:ECF transporter S component [Atribacteraceae bacterium]